MSSIQDLHPQLYYDGAWHDAPAYVRDPIKTTHGRADEQAEPAASKLDATLDNRSGAYNPKNPLSNLYGRIGRNTPVRAWLPRTPATVVEDCEDGDYAVPIAVHAGDFPWAPSTDRAHSGTQSLRSGSLYGVIGADSDVVIGIPTGTTTMTIWYYWDPVAGGAEYPQFLLDGVDVTPSIVAGAWTEFTTTRTGVALRARVVKDASSGTAGPSYLYLDDLSFGVTQDMRATVEVASWEPDRTLDYVPGAGHGDAWTTIAGRGILQRLGQGAERLISPIRRRALAPDTIASCAAYWPGEDASGSTQIASGLPGGQPMRIGGEDVQFGSSTRIPGSDPLLVLGTASYLHGDVPTTVDTTGACYFRMLIGTPSTPYPDNSTLLNLYFTGGVVGRVALRYHSVAGGSLGLEVLGADGALLATTTAWITFNMTPTDALIALELVQDGADIDYVIHKTTLHGDGTISGNTVAETFAGITALGRCYAWNIGGGIMGGTTLGHMGIANSPWWLRVLHSLPYHWIQGHTGEPAAIRFLRLCEENGIPAVVVGDPDTTVPMGPQESDTLPDLLAEVERTDVGILYEPRGGIGLAYRTRASMYNQTPKLILDWNLGQVAQPCRPAIDDQASRNDVTVSRRSGSSARAVQETGPCSIQPPPDGVGKYPPTKVDVNPRYDGDLPDLAGWYLRQGTLDETRFPQIAVNLVASPELADAVADLHVGDRILVQHVPIDISASDADLIVHGDPETITADGRVITFNCGPASAYQVAVWDQSRYWPRDCVLAAPVDADDTTLMLRTPDRWTHDDGDYDIVLAGEPATVTAVTDTVLVEDFEDGDYVLDIVPDPDPAHAWTRDSGASHSGSWSLRSPAITDNQSGVATINLPAGCRTMSFWYRTSTEEGFDLFFVLADWDLPGGDVVLLLASGEIGWTQATMDVSAYHTITCLFQKDVSDSAGADAVWVDDITLTTQTMTVVRGIAGFARPHPAGAPITLRQESRYAL